MTASNLTLAKIWGFMKCELLFPSRKLRIEHNTTRLPQISHFLFHHYLSSILMPPCNEVVPFTSQVSIWYFFMRCQLSPPTLKLHFTANSHSIYSSILNRYISHILQKKFLSTKFWTSFGVTFSTAISRHSSFNAESF